MIVRARRSAGKNLRAAEVAGVDVDERVGIANTLRTAKAGGRDPRAGSLVIARLDSAFYKPPVITAARPARARLSVTALR